MQLLLSHGADANKASRDGRTPLHAAGLCKGGAGVAMARLLLAHGAGGSCGYNKNIN